MQPDYRARLWATGGLGARPTRPISQGKTPGLGGGPSPSPSPPQPPPRPRLLLRFNGRFRCSPQSKVSRGLKNRGGKK